MRLDFEVWTLKVMKKTHQRMKRAEFFNWSEKFCEKFMLDSLGDYSPSSPLKRAMAVSTTLLCKSFLQILGIYVTLTINLSVYNIVITS